METEERSMQSVLDSIEEADAKIEAMIWTMHFAVAAFETQPSGNGLAEIWARSLLGVLIEAAENARAALGDLGFNAVGA